MRYFKTFRKHPNGIKGDLDITSKRSDRNGPKDY